MTAGCSAEREPSSETEATTSATTVNTTVDETEASYANRLPDLADEGSEQYEKFIAMATEMHEADPNATFSVRSDSDINSGELFYILSVYTEDQVIDYVLIDGEWAEYRGDVYHNYEAVYPYEVFIDLPYITDHEEFQYTPMFSGELLAPSSAHLVDDIADGTWYGELIALSDYGSSALIKVGEPVSFDRDEILSLSEGDAVGYGEAVISSVNVDEEQVVIDMNGLYTTELTTIPGGDPSRLYMCDSEGNLYFDTMELVIVPISPDCEINGEAFPDSLLWYQCSNDAALRRNNGWIECVNVVAPVVIENGEIVSLYI